MAIGIRITRDPICVDSFESEKKVVRVSEKLVIAIPNRSTVKKKGMISSPTTMPLMLKAMVIITEATIVKKDCETKKLMP